jgi:osmotically-inducible protein OsmY
VRNKPTKTQNYRLVSLLAIIFLLKGCAGVVIGSAATSAMVANDPRTTGTVIEDQSIEIKTTNLLRKNKALVDGSRVSVTCYNERILLTGQARNEKTRSNIADLVKRVEKVRQIHNEIVVSAPISMLARANDTYLTTKVKSRLLARKELRVGHIKVVSEDGVVFLLGLVDIPTENAISKIARTTRGVKKVVTLFERL